MKRPFPLGLLFALSAVVALSAIAAAAVPPALAPLDFLLGRWSSPGTSTPGGATGEAEFSRDLQDQVIVRRSYAEYEVAAGAPARRHDDLMVIYAQGDSLRADYFDSEGHVIRYRVRAPEAGRAVFLSEAMAGQPQFRLSYVLEPSGALKGSFEMAPPNAPGAFKPYLQWEGTKAPAEK